MTPTPQTPDELLKWATAELPPEDDVDGNYKLIGYLRQVCSNASVEWKKCEQARQTAETERDAAIDGIRELSKIYAPALNMLAALAPDAPKEAP